MSLQDHGHQIGFWRHPSHCRKVAAAYRFDFQRAIERGRRRRMIESAIVTTSSILAAAIVVVSVAASVVYCSAPDRPASPPVPLREESVVYVREVRGCPR